MNNKLLPIVGLCLAALLISLPISWAILQLHPSWEAPQPTASEPLPKAGLTYFQKEPEEFWKKWIDPVALGTFMLAVAAFWTARTTQAQVRLGREEFNATHRPELIVREVAWAAQEMDGGTVINDGAMTFTVINRGRNSCSVVESAFELRSNSPDGRALGTNGLNALQGIELASGEFHSFTYDLTYDELLSSASRTMHRSYFRGTIIYEDRVHIRRRYVFCRVCARDSDAFTHTDNPEDEYTD
jgi:hypothetical protein